MVSQSADDDKRAGSIVGIVLWRGLGSDASVGRAASIALLHRHQYKTRQDNTLQYDHSKTHQPS